ncbi:hypothetical protein PMAYCL1PPCAC_04090, partial [Pristionchus mayeri]
QYQHGRRRRAQGGDVEEAVDGVRGQGRGKHLGEAGGEACETRGRRPAALGMGEANEQKQGSRLLLQPLHGNDAVGEADAARRETQEPRRGGGAVHAPAGQARGQPSAGQLALRQDHPQQGGRSQHPHRLREGDQRAVVAGGEARQVPRARQGVLRLLLRQQGWRPRILQPQDDAAGVHEGLVRARRRRDVRRLRHGQRPAPHLETRLKPRPLSTVPLPTVPLPYRNQGRRMIYLVVTYPVSSFLTPFFHCISLTASDL